MAHYFLLIGERSSLFVGFCIYCKYVIVFGVVISLKTDLTEETIFTRVLVSLT